VNDIKEKKTLVILAAGIGARYGGGIKQLEPVGPTDELIIDYSVHDAIAAGFNKVVFIIRHDIESDFRERIGDRIERVCEPLGVEIRYAFQEKDMMVDHVPDGRIKPWGTGHAVLCAADMIDSGFAVINSDDYYGREAFRKAADLLALDRCGLIGYVLKNTLSDNGGVTRGICSLDGEKLTGIKETRNIRKAGPGAEADGVRLDEESFVSMNFWCFPLSFLEVLKDGFPKFRDGMTDPLTEEYLLPGIADGMIKDGVPFTLMPTDDQWFGVTYKEDRQSVVDSFRKLYADGVYRDDLYSDLS
jgi:hypothetical protein